MSKTKIEWTEETWNPTTGCDRVSPGCDHCYALTEARRLKGMGNPRYQRDGNPKTSGPGFGLTLHEDKVTEPLKWKRPRRVFVNSMSDLFHAGVAIEFLASVFAVMGTARQHTFQILTKRPRRMQGVLADPAFQDLVAYWAVEGYGIAGPSRWPLPNVWLGTSVEDQQRADQRIPLLLETPAAMRFLSCEPLLGPVELRDEWLEVELQAFGGNGTSTFPHIGWVIVGGESGRQARPMHPDWVRRVRDACTRNGTAFFFKQWGEWSPDPSSKPKPDAMVLSDGRAIGPREEVWAVDTLDAVPMAKVGKGKAGAEIDGRTWAEYPDDGGRLL